MSIQEYDQVNPLGVLNLNLLSLNYPLTPEKVAAIRRLDPRPFPFFGLYVVVDGIVAGQVLVYRLSVMTTMGLEDVGGVGAVCTHPAYSGRGIASQLIEEAHQRMHAAGLRFSTLSTARHRGAYALYQQLGYEDIHIPLTTMAHRDVIPSDTQLRAERVVEGRLNLADSLFRQIAAERLGFSRRPENFLTMLEAIGEINAGDFWLFWCDRELVGYGIARILENVLIVKHLMIKTSSVAGLAISAMIKDLPVSYIQVRLDHPTTQDHLQQMGFPAGLPDWSTFMVKGIWPGLTANQARCLFGIDTEHFLISPADVT